MTRQAAAAIANPAAVARSHAPAIRQTHHSPSPSSGRDAGLRMTNSQHPTGADSEDDMEAASLPPAAPAAAPAAVAADSPPASEAARAVATGVLSQLLNKTLVVHTSDGRLFTGLFKCTDWDCNVVLAQATEYRQPSRRQREAAAAAAATGGGDRVVLNMQERDLGLIVVPGKHIVKIEVEEFASQMRHSQLQTQTRP